MLGKVAVIGAGSWGTTVAGIAATSSHTVLWARRPELADALQSRHVNPDYLPDVTLPASLHATSSREEAVDSGLFGPVRGEHLARTGDVVVICRDDTVVLASAHEPEMVSKLVAFHGSLTPVETAIPLLTFVGGVKR